LPEIRAARAELARLRIEADSRNAEIRQITIDIEALLAGNNFVGAERMLDFAMRRHPAHTGWAELRRRIDQAKSGSGIRQFIADARAAMAKKDWAEANRQIARAEAIDRTAPAVIAARKNLDDARRDASLQAQKFIAAGDAAVKAKNWPAAEKAADEAAAADPFNPTVQAAVRKLKADIAAGKGAGSGPGAVAPLLAAADAQIAKKNWPEAAKEIVKAEAIDAKSPAVIAARKRLEDARQAAAQEAKKFIAAGEAATKAKNWPAAEKAAADAAAADPFDPAVQAEVKKLRDEIALGKGAGPGLGAIAPLIAAADAQIAKKNWPEAAKDIAKAEAIDAKSPAVIAARKRLDDARRDAFNKAQPFAKAAQDAIKKGNRANADKNVAQVKLIDPFGPALKILAAEYKKRGW
jgi:hypothetical protein